MRGKVTTTAIHRLAAEQHGIITQSSSSMPGLARRASTAGCKRAPDPLRPHRSGRHDPLTTAARTLTDLAHTPDPASLTRAVNDARLNRHLSLDDLPPRLRRNQPTRPTRSAFEDAFRTFCARHRLPQPQINAIVAGYEVDAYWPAQRLIAELDGEEFHEDFEADRA